MWIIKTKLIHLNNANWIAEYVILPLNKTIIFTWEFVFYSQFSFKTTLLLFICTKFNRVIVCVHRHCECLYNCVNTCIYARVWFSFYCLFLFSYTELNCVKIILRFFSFFLNKYREEKTTSFSVILLYDYGETLFFRSN